MCIAKVIFNRLKYNSTRGFCHFSDQKYWVFDDDGYVSFKALSLPANLAPETIVKVIQHTHTCTQHKPNNIRSVFFYQWERLYSRMTSCVCADREAHLSVTVYRGWRWPELFKHRVRKPGRSYFTAFFFSSIAKYWCGKVFINLFLNKYCS